MGQRESKEEWMNLSDGEALIYLFIYLDLNA